MSMEEGRDMKRGAVGLGAGIEFPAWLTMLKLSGVTITSPDGLMKPYISDVTLPERVAVPEGTRVFGIPGDGAVLLVKITLVGDAVAPTIAGQSDITVLGVGDGPLRPGDRSCMWTTNERSLTCS